MEPRVFTRGNADCGPQRRRGGRASMEPRGFTRGNAEACSSAKPSESCFNGATRLHAWKQADEEMSDLRWIGFNGATRLHAWKPSGWSEVLPRSLRFNGATRLHAWKPFASCSVI